jgi:hypothetical protein
MSDKAKQEAGSEKRVFLLPASCSLLPAFSQRQGVARVFAALA